MLEGRYSFLSNYNTFNEMGVLLGDKTTIYFRDAHESFGYRVLLMADRNILYQVERFTRGIRRTALLRASDGPVFARDNKNSQYIYFEADVLTYLFDASCRNCWLVNRTLDFFARVFFDTTKSITIHANSSLQVGRKSKNHPACLRLCTIHPLHKGPILFRGMEPGAADICVPIFRQLCRACSP